ncbi:MAG: hypothetical protein J6T39_00190 [Clostridia bacterium]|nr:hypothetical protein [Clostridia bacterium]
MFLLRLFRPRFFKRFLILGLAAIGIFACLKFSSNNKIQTQARETLGTWWWSKSLNVDEYLTFALKNKVTEVYYCDYSLDTSVANFVEKVSKKNIKVYCLAGEKEWLDDRTGLDNLIESYVEFQANHQYKFAGIHLDIEPHQFGDFSTKRAEYLYKLVDLMNENKTRYSQIKFDYDIPFWLDDEIEYNGQTKETYKHIIDVADRTFLMSYRDTADEMVSVSQDEIEYAKKYKKVLFLCAETYSEEGDKVSYLEEGNAYMIEQLEKLRKQLPTTFGIAIHNIKSWKNLSA